MYTQITYMCVARADPLALGRQYSVPALPQGAGGESIFERVAVRRDQDGGILHMHMLVDTHMPQHTDAHIGKQVCVHMHAYVQVKRSKRI